MRAVLMALLSLPALLAAESRAAPLSPEDVLLRMQSAGDGQSFQGSFSYQRSGDFSTHGIWHQAVSGEVIDVRERLLRLDGPLQEIVRQGGQVACASADLQELLAPPRYGTANLDWQALRQGYELHFAADYPNTARVAGREALVVKLVPRDRHRYGMEFSADLQTGVLLKSVLFDEQGQVLERLQFLTFSEGVPAPTDLEGSRACLPLAAASAALPPPEVQANWHLQWLPAGFHLLSAGESQMPSAAMTQLDYSDGLAHFSVFLEPLGQQQPIDVRRQLGPTAVVSRRLLEAGGNLMVTVVGEIPAATAERLALSIRAGPAVP